MKHEKKKCVCYRGEAFAVPEWVRFVATEFSGEIWGFENKPVLEMEDGVWYNEGSGRCCRIAEANGFETIENWEISLKEVPNGKTEND